MRGSKDCSVLPAANYTLLRPNWLAQTDPRLNRTQESQALCAALDWRKPDGGLKQMSARVALLRMQRDGLLTLPPPLTKMPHPGPAAASPRSDPPARLPRPVALAQVRPLRLSLLRRSDPRSRLWNEFVERYHYFGYKPLPGAQLRYFVQAPDGLLLALLGRGAAAWKTAPRDRFVGWDPATRQRNLPLVVNRARYLILPWIRIPSLASHLLACLQRQLPDDWQQRYRLRPVPLETFCETPRFEAPAIAPPIGSTWARRQAAASSIRVTSTTRLSRTYSSNPSARTGSKSSIASPAAVFHGPLDRLCPVDCYLRRSQDSIFQVVCSGRGYTAECLVGCTIKGTRGGKEMPDLRAELHEEIDRMATEDLAGLKEFLATYPDKIGAVVRMAPWDDEPVTEAEMEAMDEALEWLEQNGGKGIPHDEVMREFGLE